MENTVHVIRRRDGNEAQRLLKVLADDIISGRLAPETKLNEQNLARRFGVSRGPLREAIRRLQERRLVTCIPNSGARVARHSAREIMETYQLRETLEGMAARLAARNMTDAEIVDLRAVHEAEKRLGHSDNFQNDFHMCVARGSHNQQLLSIINEEYYGLLMLWRRCYRSLQVDSSQSYVEHGRILDAIEHRDEDCAELLARRHVRRLHDVSMKEVERHGLMPVADVHAFPPALSAGM